MQNDIDNQRTSSSCTSQDATFSSCACEEGEETKVCLSITTIENIIRKDDILIKFVIEHKGSLLGESQVFKINADHENANKIHHIDFTILVPYSAVNIHSICPLVASPLLITVFEIFEKVLTASPSYETRPKEKKRSKSKHSSKSAEEISILGMCNLDLLPIGLGETEYEEKMILEIPINTWSEKDVAWENLPRVSVCVKSNNSENIISDGNMNIMSISIESIYNAPNIFCQNMEYTCGTILCTNQEDKYSRVIFDVGKWTDFHDFERIKSWQPLQNLQSRAKLSKYKIQCGYDNVTNHFKQNFILEDAVTKNEPRIEWNCMYRTLLSKIDVENLRQRLHKYKYWPFEILISEKKRGKSVPYSAIYQGFVDISSLLFPGRTTYRALTQLHTHNPSEMLEKTGFLRSIIFQDNHLESISTKTVKSLSLLSKENSEKCLDSYPLYTEDGKPVLLLVEFELHRPFYLARDLENFTNALQILHSKPKPKGPVYAFTPKSAQDQYIQSVKQIVDDISHCYREFSERCDCQERDESELCGKISCNNDNDKSYLTKKEIDNYCDTEAPCIYKFIGDDLSRFKQFLHESGHYVTIRTKLRSDIINLLDQKFAMNNASVCSMQNQSFITSCYAYLVDQMHTALNSKIDVRYDTDCDKFNYKEIWFRAEEAYELKNYDKAESLLIQIIHKDRFNADPWVIYTMYLLKRNMIEEAIESCREAINLDTRHKIALLIYGVLLAIKSEYTTAETFLKAVVHFYPRFVEGWVVLHLLYVKIQYHPGIDLTIEVAEKCLKDRVRPDDFVEILRQEPIAWSMMLCRPNKIFLITTALLLKLNLFHFAGLALCQELCHAERSVEFLYYLSVNHYLQGEYEAALQYLNEAESIIGLEYSIAALLGHTYFKLGNIQEAVQFYEAVDMLYDRPENIYLVHIRLGYYYLNNSQFNQAKKVILRVCKLLPTCLSWLGIGIADYHTCNFEECELVLMEANQYDCEEPKVWAYLCLLNMSLGRYDEFSQCYRMMVKNNLKCDKIWRLITHNMETVGFTPPIISMNDYKDDKCKC